MYENLNSCMALIMEERQKINFRVILNEAQLP